MSINGGRSLRASEQRATIDARPQPPGPHDIFIIGLGIVNVDQVTREVDRAIRCSNEVLYVETGVGVHRFLAERCAKVTNLTTAYVEEGDRLKTYHYMAARVIEAALNRAPVTFALYGHPTIFAYPPFLIQEMAALLDLSVKVYPGVSALDCILAELMVDPASNGLLMFEATDVLLRGIPLRPDVATLLWQIGTLETALYSNDVSQPQRFANFKTHLLKYYPPGHEVFAIRCSSYPLMSSTIYRFSLQQLEDYAPRLNSGFTLYVPPAVILPVADANVAENLDSVAHLRSITRLRATLPTKNAGMLDGTTEEARPTS